MMDCSISCGPRECGATKALGHYWILRPYATLVSADVQKKDNDVLIEESLIAPFSREAGDVEYSPRQGWQGEILTGYSVAVPNIFKSWGLQWRLTRSLMTPSELICNSATKPARIRAPKYPTAPPPAQTHPTTVNLNPPKSRR